MDVLYRHKKTGTLLTIKKRYRNNIVSCKIARKCDYEVIHNNVIIDTIICNINNLIRV